MLTTAHALSPFLPCPFDCPFCCAKNNATNQNIKLTHDYWENAEISLAIHQYQNLMLTGDTEPTLFPEWLEKIVKLADKYNIITELRTHNYNFVSKGYKFSQLWYSITDAKTLEFLPHLYSRGMASAQEVNFAFLINKDFKATEIVNMRKRLINSKFTVRYLLKDCGSDAIIQWIKENHYTFNEDAEKFLEMNNIRVKRNYAAEYDILRQDGKIYHEWQ
jgi:hypothetical protein